MYRLILFSLLFSFSYQTHLQAQTECGTTSLQQLIAKACLAQSSGYRLTHDLICSKLDDGYHKFYTLTLRGGTNYMIFAACDGDCDDIDLFIYDENDNLVAKDPDLDDDPVITVTPSWTGSFRLKVAMPGCKVDPCRFGVMIFGK